MKHQTSQTALRINSTSTVPLIRPQMAIINEDFPKLNRVDANEISEMLNHILALMNIKIGDTKAEMESMDRQMLLVGDLIRTEFGKLVTVPEVKHAFKMYVSKQFPEIRTFRILDCIVVGEVLTAYIEFRNDSLKKYTDKKIRLKAESENRVMEKDERFKILRRGVWNAYLDYLKRGYVLDDRFHLFDFLFEVGVLPKASESKAIANAYIEKKAIAVDQVRGKGTEKRFKALVLSGMFAKLKDEWTIDISGFRKFYNTINSKFDKYD